MRADANFDNSALTPSATLDYDPGRALGSPTSPPMPGRAWGVLVCGDELQDALFDYDTAAFYRQDSFSANADYKGRRYTFQVNEVKRVNIVVTSTFFTPFVTVQRTIGDMKQSIGSVQFDVTVDNMGEFAIEVSSVEKHKKGPFTISVICSTGDICGIPISFDDHTTPFEFSFELVQRSLWLCAVKSETDSWLEVDGILNNDFDLYPGLGIDHYWAVLQAGHHTGYIYNDDDSPLTFKHWAFKTESADYTLLSPAVEASQSDVGKVCFSVEKEWTADDVFLIVPGSTIGGAAADCDVNIIRTDTSAVVATAQNGTFVVPATTTYRIEVVIDPSVINYYTLCFFWDCWVKADASVSPLTGNGFITLTGTNTSKKRSTLEWLETSWYLEHLIDELTSELVENTVTVSKVDYSKVLGSCTGITHMRLQLLMADEAFRVDKSAEFDIDITAISVPVTPLTFDIDWVAAANAYHGNMILPQGLGVWDGTLIRCETLNGIAQDTPYSFYAADNGESVLGFYPFIVGKDCSEYKGAGGFQWYFQCMYQDGVTIWFLYYKKDVLSGTALGTYTRTPTPGAPTELPLTLTIT